MKYRNIDRKFRSTVTVAYRKCRVEVTSVGLAHARPIKIFNKNYKGLGDRKKEKKQEETQTDDNTVPNPLVF